MLRPLLVVVAAGCLIGAGLGVISVSGAPEQLMAMIPTPAPTATPVPPPCIMADGTPARARLTAILDEWSDAVKVAAASSRIALPGPVAQLQRIRRETQAATLPVCAESVRTHMVASMTEVVDGFLGFMASDTGYERHFDTAAGQMRAVDDEMDRLSP